MSGITKAKSPFYPGQPVPKEYFAGRLNEIKTIIRAIDQVASGKPQAVFLTGEYGIGKSSLAGFMRYYAEKNKSIVGIHVMLGGAETLDDVAAKTVEAAIRSEAYEPKITEKVRNALAKYVGKQEFFGANINFEVLRADTPNISSGFLPFLRELLNRMKEDGIKGIILIFDEINGITANPKFSHFIKALVDENALSPAPLPLLLMLCGVEERRREMIESHQPIERIFEIVKVVPMTDAEMREFFTKAFESVGMQVMEDALVLLCHYSAGFPKIIHLIGEKVFWTDEDNVIKNWDAFTGILAAAKDVGAKFVDQQVYKALQSKDYHSILAKLGTMSFDLSFHKKEIEKELSQDEKKKFNNFLQRMKELNVIKSGDERGEYVFNSRMVRVYIMLKSSEKNKKES